MFTRSKTNFLEIFLWQHVLPSNAKLKRRSRRELTFFRVKYCGYATFLFRKLVLRHNATFKILLIAIMFSWKSLTVECHLWYVWHGITQI